MSIIIKEVNSKAALKAFIYLPEIIHKDHHNWVHPLYIDEEKFFSRRRNPAFAHNATVLFLAYENEEAVGRIMGIVPYEYNKLNGLSTARFSYFECYKDKRVFDALLHAVEHWARQHNCNKLIGPMGFSDKEPQGFVTAGFDAPTMMVTNCSFSFMKDFILQNGYNPHVELCQYDVPIANETVSRYENFTKRVAQHLNIKMHEFKSTRQVRKFVRPVFNLINATYQKIYGFTAVTQDEMDEFGSRFLPLLNPKLIKIITNEKDEVLAFVIAMADMSPGLKKARGRLLPLGWYHIYKAAKSSKRLVLLLGAVHPSMQGKGLDAVLATKLIKSAVEAGFTTMDSHLIMRDNHKMRGEIERLDKHKLYKEYTIYKKEI